MGEDEPLLHMDMRWLCAQSDDLLTCFGGCSIMADGDEPSLHVAFTRNPTHALLVGRE